MTGDLNIGDNMGNSIFIGGKYGRGYHYVLHNDVTFFHCTCYDHCSSLLSYLFSAILWDLVAMSEGENMENFLLYIPFEMFIETKGGHDHVISTLQNKLIIFSLFLVTIVYKLIVIRSFPSILYLNRVERKMSVLNIDFSNLALQMKL